MWRSDPHQIIEAPSNGALTCELQELRVQRDGYTAAGDYFGTPGVVFYVSGDVEGCLRASSKEEALFKLRVSWPLLREEGEAYSDPDIGRRAFNDASGDCAGVFVPHWPRRVPAYPIPDWLSSDDVSILGSLRWRASLGYGWDPDEDCNERGWFYFVAVTGEYNHGDGMNPYRGERDSQGSNA